MRSAHLNMIIDRQCHRVPIDVNDGEQAVMTVPILCTRVLPNGAIVDPTFLQSIIDVQLQFLKRGHCPPIYNDEVERYGRIGSVMALELHDDVLYAVLWLEDPMTIEWVYDGKLRFIMKYLVTDQFHLGAVVVSATPSVKKGLWWLV